MIYPNLFKILRAKRMISIYLNVQFSNSSSGQTSWLSAIM